MFSRLLNAPFSCVGKLKQCDWFEIGGIPGTFSRTITGEAEPGWARRPETSVAAFSPDDAFTDSSELATCWTLSYTVLKESYLMSR